MSKALNDRLRKALSRYHARDLAGAQQACTEILGRFPNQPEALHLQGVLHLERGDAHGAVESIRRAVERDARNPAILENLGLAYLAAGDAVNAEAQLRRALGFGAAHATLHARLGLALLAQHRLAEAVAELRSATELAPDDPDILLNLGNALAEQGEGDRALACYRGVLALSPRHRNARFNIGTQLRRMGRLAESESAYREVLALDPRCADAHHNLGVIYQQQGQLEKAAASYRDALVLDPGHIQAQNNLGNMLRAQGSLDEAAELFRRALELNPDQADAYINLGNLECRRERYAEAEHLYERALILEPASYEAHNNLGDALLAQGRLEEAAARFQRALELNPGFATAQYNLGLVHLFRHDFGRGWQGYERRLECEDARYVTRRNAASVTLYERLPRWRGPGEAGVDEVAIWLEQGIGDQVLFSTLIPELIAAGVRFVYEVDARLLAAYERAFPGQRFVRNDEPPGEAIQRSSRVLLAGSLPGLFRPSRASFERQPRKLLAALPERAARYRRRLDALGRGLKVAISWRSSRKDNLGPRKTVPLVALAPVLTTSGAHFVDVQYGDTMSERRAAQDATGVELLHFDEVDYYNDLEEVLAMLEACDLVITASNATAHLAGALGMRTWLLYPGDKPPFHYWAHGGSFRSLWYPSVEIVTSAQFAEWPALIEHAAVRLARERVPSDRGHA
jgi:tetratricopeptide (TPR) repeat protein